MSSNTQYTIRGVPTKLDTFLRRQASLRGVSLNQTVLDYIQAATKLDIEDIDDDFDWIIGANTIDDSSLAAMRELKKMDKRKSRLW